MNKRILISEEEKIDILKMHNKAKSVYLLKEDDDMLMDGGKVCITTFEKSNKDQYNRPKKLTIVEVNGQVSVKNMKAKVGQTISAQDEIKISEGGSLMFEDIEGMGQAYLKCENGVGIVDWVWN